MKKLSLSLFVLSGHLILYAQDIISVSPGTNMHISAGTSFTSNGLVLIPSSGFTVNGAIINKATTVSHSTVNNYISRVYKFSSNSAPFTGTIQFYYQDGELNGLTENSLRVNIHDGTSWQSVNSAVNDETNNYVLTNTITNKVINELTLADALHTLPLLWDNISAYRQGQAITIEWGTKQEFNVSHFSVEKSIDGRNWTTIADNIAATNTTLAKRYAANDNSYAVVRLYYRIRQTDMDGKTTYSPVAAVGAVSETTRLLVFPNPVSSGFYISNIRAGDISNVQLFTISGILTRSWTGAQTSYNIKDIPAGIYQLRIHLKDGSYQNFKISK